MTNLRLVLLATSALTATQITALPSHAQTAPQVMAQAGGEVGPDGKPKAPPKGAPAPAPARPAPPAAAPPPHPAPPTAAPPAPPPVPPKPPAPPSAAPSAAPSTAPAPQLQQRNAPEQLQQKNAPAPVLPPPAGAKQPPAAGAPPAAAPPTQTAPPPAGAKQPPAAGALPAAAPPTQTAPPPAGAGTTPPPPPRNGPPPNAAPNAAPAPGGAGGQTSLPPGAPAGAAPLVRHAPPTVSAPIPAAPPPAQALAPIAPGAPAPGPRRMDDFRGARRETQEGGRTVFNEPGRVIVVDPGGQSFIRHNEEDRFRYGARDIRTEQVGGETRTIVIRPDGSQIITVNGRDGQMLRRIRRDERGREIIIIDNSYRDPRAVGGFYVDLPPPVIGIPYNRYIVEAEDAPPDLIYDTMLAPPVERIARRNPLQPVGAPIDAEHRSQQHQLRNRVVGDSTRSSGEAAGDRGWTQSGDRAQPARGVPDRGPYRCGGQRCRQSVAVGSARRIRRRVADTAIPGPCGKPDLAGIRRAISERTDRRAKPHQPPRHHPPHHALAERRNRIAAAPAPRHRAAAVILLPLPAHAGRGRRAFAAGEGQGTLLAAKHC